MKRFTFAIFLLFLVFPFSCGFLNIAHRGDNENGKYAEHSWVAYDRAVGAHVDYLELDLQKTADNILVVSHDENMSRVFGIDKNIKDYPYQKLNIYINQNNESMHSLEDVFRRYQNSNVKFMIEPKGDDDTKLLLQLIKKYQLEKRVLLESFSKESLLTCSRVSPQIPTTQLSGDYESISLPKYYANNFYSEKTANYLNAHQKGYLLWGVNTVDQMKQFVQPEAGVSGILTDFPIELATVLHANDAFKRYYESVSYPSNNISGDILLKNGRRVYADQVKLKGNKLYYHAKPDLWINYSDLKNSNNSAPQAKTGKITLRKKTAIYTDPSFEKNSGRKLAANSTWNYFAVKKVAGKTAYNLGGSQWIRQ